MCLLAGAKLTKFGKILDGKTLVVKSAAIVIGQLINMLWVQS